MLLTCIFVLVLLGVVISLAASPSVALAKDLPAFHFVNRHVIFATGGVIGMLAVSLLSPRGVRRLALGVFAVALVLLVVIAIGGESINGAKRWIRLLGFSFQPSEVAKPAFVVLAAWAFAEMQRRRDVPALPMAIALYVTLAALLVIQPDVGQTLLVTLVWGALFLLAGLPLPWAGAFAGLLSTGLALAYVSLTYVRGRIDAFLAGAYSETSQMGRAYHSFVQGGFFGRGPGEGTIKTILPDAHTDFIFAVIAEEYGVIACLGLVCLFGVIVFRAFVRGLAVEELDVRYGIIGLSLLVGLQALINMGVNVGLLPAKGMTLPMISAGGSSMIGMSLTLGMLLALTRARPELGRYRRRVGTSEPVGRMPEHPVGQN
ncbi:MAG: cell division protein FtsW [Hyphomicrobiaceae bacterium]|nr:cell division protein FtsW [Hyphomicrobiaceae bacterium]